MRGLVAPDRARPVPRQQAGQELPGYVRELGGARDSGVVHRLWSAGSDGAITLATIDAHPTGQALSWSDADRLFTAIAGHERNRATRVVA